MSLSRGSCLVPSVVLVALVLLCCSDAPMVVAYPTFTRVNSTVPFYPRYGAFAFQWYGQVWVVGGLDSTVGAVYLGDVVSSFDLGRTWDTTSSLPASCDAVVESPIVYANSLYLICGLNDRLSGDTSLNTHTTTFVSSDPVLSTASWTALTPNGNAQDDGLHHRATFNTQRMAVPFDGVGTLIMVNGRDSAGNVYNDVWWLSASGNFQPGVVNPSTQWHQFIVPGASANYTAPWPARYAAVSSADEEGLMLIMAGRQTYGGGVYFNDVWQMTWRDGQTAPKVYQLTANPGFTPRSLATLWTVHDALFLYGGLASGAAQDDLWQSMDYGATWYLITSSATGTPRYQASPLTVSRRFFIVGGETEGQAGLNDVWVAYW